MKNKPNLEFNSYQTFWHVFIKVLAINNHSQIPDDSFPRQQSY